MYATPNQNRTAQDVSGGVGFAFDGPAPRLSGNVADYVGPNNLFTLVVPSRDPEVVVLADLFQHTPDPETLAAAVNVPSGETLLSIQTRKAAGFVAINDALRPLADRHQSAFAYTYGPVGVVSPSLSVHDVEV
jgi:hypothetical protein